jgi:hypothetical protein
VPGQGLGLGVRELPRFDRRFFGAVESFTVIGSGGIGGKARGLLRAREVLAAGFPPGKLAGLAVEVPTLSVIGTDVFDFFLARNRLSEIADSDLADRPLAATFQRADLPTEVVGDLWELAARVHSPLAVRSSSLLEDALAHPFAGVYATKMIPNQALDPATRFRKLVEAVKFVYASTFFPEAKSYRRAAGLSGATEKMAVVIQEVVGRRHGPRFYPEVSGVCRSYNYYPSGAARPEEGVASLALGLGKTIVDGGRSWSYSPAHPRVAPPHASVDELIDETQREFWAVNMGRSIASDATSEDEYLTKAGLAEAEVDGVLSWLASTYDPASDRMAPGVGSHGVRVLNFAPVLGHGEPPLNDAVRALLAAFEEATGSAVEIEFALTLPVGGAPARLGFLQVRPMAVGRERVEVGEAELGDPRAVIRSRRALGNGEIEGLRELVFVRREGFEARSTREVARELAELNRQLAQEGLPYLLLGFGRWGSSDPWLGIPVGWGDVAGARVLVEATLPTMNVELSQGAHFFHNLIGFGVPYLCVPFTEPGGIDWEWLESLPVVSETALVRRVRAPAPLRVKVDGRSARAVVLKGEP